MPVAQPERDGPTDLLGAVMPDDPDALVRKALEAWIHWQSTIGRKVVWKITPRRRKLFMDAWNGPLRKNWTFWLVVCRRCVRNQALAGAMTGRSTWNGATLTWLFWNENLIRVLDGTTFPDNYKVAAVPGAA